MWSCSVSSWSRLLRQSFLPGCVWPPTGSTSSKSQQTISFLTSKPKLEQLSHETTNLTLDLWSLLVGITSWQAEFRAKTFFFSWLTPHTATKHLTFSLQNKTALRSLNDDSNLNVHVSMSQRKLWLAGSTAEKNMLDFIDALFFVWSLGHIMIQTPSWIKIFNIDVSNLWCVDGLYHTQRAQRIANVAAYQLGIVTSAGHHTTHTAPESMFPNTQSLEKQRV